MKRKGKRGTYIRTHELGETYKDSRGKDKSLWAYSPTDCPHSTYTSEDMALAAAMYEHGHIRTKQSEKAERDRKRREERRGRRSYDD